MAGENIKSINKIFTTNQHELMMYNKNFLPRRSADLRSAWSFTEEKAIFVLKLRVPPCPLWLISLILFSLISCQSIPKVPIINLETADSLPFESGANTYVFADAKKARSIIELLPIPELNNKEIKQMLDKTRFFAAALFQEKNRRRFQIAAQGNYPSAANHAISLNKSWQKRRSANGGEYWHSPTNGISVLIGADYAYAAATNSNEPFEPFSPQPGVKVPKDFNEFRKDSPLSCWIANPTVLLSNLFAGFPVQSVSNLFFNLSPAPDEKYDVLIRLQFENPSHAKGMAVILSLAVGFSSDPLISALLSNPPTVNGNNIDLRCAPLSDKDIKNILTLML